MLTESFKEYTYDQHPSDREHGPTVLIVDDEPLARERLELLLLEVQDLGKIHVLHAMTIQSALETLAKTQVHVALLDKNLSSDPTSPEFSGIEAIPEMLALQPHLQILMVTGSREIKDIVRAIHLGALSYTTKEMANELLTLQIQRALDIAMMKLDKVRRERGEDTTDRELGGKSLAFRGVIRQADVLSESNRPLLLLGESGTGKTELARWIHRRRGLFLKQKDRPFFAVNVTTLARDMIESELFGHEKGAFTDASQSKQGLFELANNGTLFLDEIGDLPLDLQPKLLTVIEDGSFMRLGGTKMMTAFPKLIFATNRNLEKMVEEGTFRKDLYFRISMFPIIMPSLSERKEDIPDIIRALLPRCCRDNRVQVQYEDIPQDFIDHLMDSSIDGNIRGIQHQLDRLLVLSPRDKNDKPVLTRWRAISGLYQKKLVNGNFPPSPVQMKAPLTYQELMARPWDLLSGSFPGLNELQDEITTRLVTDAHAQHKSNRKVARLLKISESKSSGLIRSLPKSEKSAKELNS